MNFEGAWTALVTPMNSDGGIDWDGFDKNVQFQIEQGITGVVPAGTTGESPSLRWEEHNAVIKRALEQASGKCKVIAGTGSNSTQEAVESTEHALEHGADACLLVDCYYNAPSSIELRNEYYGVLAEVFPDTAFVPYIIPGRSGTALSVEDLAILAHEHPNIHVVKEATGDIERMRYTRRLLGADFFIMSGDDDLTFNMMTDPTIAAQGVISVMSNICPAAITQMIMKLRSGDIEGATDLHEALSPLLGMVTVKAGSARTLPNGTTVIVEDKFRNPVAVKTLMRAFGMAAGVARQPLGKMTVEGINVVRETARTVWLDNPELFAPIEEFYGVDIESRIADDFVWSSLSY